MAMGKEIEITIGEDGSIKIEQLGYSGQECAGAIDELIKSLGCTNLKTTNKQEYYKKQGVHIHQKHK